MYRIMGLLVFYKSYSLFKSTQQDNVITYKEILDNGEENTLLKDSGVDAEKFYPSYLLLSGVAQTCYAGIMKFASPEYEKEYLMLPDGGQISLQSHILPGNCKGIVIIIPGICGDGDTSYIINSVKKARDCGYSSIVVNHRGCGNTKLLTPLTYHAGSSFDTKEAISYIESKYPDMPLYGLSFSLGSNILGRYVAEESSHCKLKGAVVVCCPFDAFECSVYSEKSCFGLVSRYLAWSAMKKIFEHPEMIPLIKETHGIDLVEMKKTCKRFKDFDDKVTAKMFGYNGIFDYYKNCSVIQVLKDVKVKTLFISSIDDPFFGPEIFPHKEFRENDNIYLLATRGGGHIGYYSSVFFSSEQWHNIPAFKFFDHLNECGKEIKAE